jgi:WD40 repeat protein
VWDVASRKQLGEPITGHTDSVKSVSYAPDGKAIASGSSDKTLRFWDPATGKQIGEAIVGHE